jgi:hypothetical protein
MACWMLNLLTGFLPVFEHRAVCFKNIFDSKFYWQDGYRQPASRISALDKQKVVEYYERKREEDEKRGAAKNKGMEQGRGSLSLEAPKAWM